MYRRPPSAPYAYSRGEQHQAHHVRRAHSAPPLHRTRPTDHPLGRPPEHVEQLSPARAADIDRPSSLRELGHHPVVLEPGLRAEGGPTLDDATYSPGRPSSARDVEIQSGLHVYRLRADGTPSLAGSHEERAQLHAPAFARAGEAAQLLAQRLRADGAPSLAGSHEERAHLDDGELQPGPHVDRLRAHGAPAFARAGEAAQLLAQRLRADGAPSLAGSHAERREVDDGELQPGPHVARLRADGAPAVERAGDAGQPVVDRVRADGAPAFDGPRDDRRQVDDAGRLPGLRVDPLRAESAPAVERGAGQRQHLAQPLGPDSARGSALYSSRELRPGDVDHQPSLRVERPRADGAPAFERAGEASQHPVHRLRADCAKTLGDMPAATDSQSNSNARLGGSIGENHTVDSGLVLAAPTHTHETAVLVHEFVVDTAGYASEQEDDETATRPKDPARRVRPATAQAIGLVHVRCLQMLGLGRFVLPAVGALCIFACWSSGIIFACAFYFALKNPALTKQSIAFTTAATGLAYLYSYVFARAFLATDVAGAARRTLTMRSSTLADIGLVHARCLQMLGLEKFATPAFCALSVFAACLSYIVVPCSLYFVRVHPAPCDVWLVFAAKAAGLAYLSSSICAYAFHALDSCGNGKAA